MVIDSSALIAILETEPEAEQLAEAIEQDQVRLISAASVLETTIVIENRRGEDGGKALDLLMEKLQSRLFLLQRSMPLLPVKLIEILERVNIQQS